MIYANAELHNVHELLSGSGPEMLSPAADGWLRGLADDGSAAWAAADAEGLWLARIPNDLRLKLNPAAQVNALQATGCEVRFNLGGGRARLVLKSMHQPSLVEVYQGCFLCSWHTVGVEATEITIRHPANVGRLAELSRRRGLPFDAVLTRVVLPWQPPARLIALEGDLAPPRPEQTPPRRHLAYGSSITHGASSIRPTGTYAHRTAQLLGMDLMNLGFGGGAHLEREIADHIAGRADWDIATLELGINLLGGIGADEFARRVDYFVGTIAEAHPDKWVFCIDVFTCARDYEGDGKIAEFRGAVREKVRRMGLPRLIHAPGDELLTSPAGLTADLVHPSPFGMEEIAANLAALIRRKMGPQGPRP